METGDLKMEDLAFDGLEYPVTYMKDLGVLIIVEFIGIVFLIIRNGFQALGFADRYLALWPPLASHPFAIGMEPYQRLPEFRRSKEKTGILSHRHSDLAALQLSGESGRVFRLSEGPVYIARQFVRTHRISECSCKLFKKPGRDIQILSSRITIERDD